MRGLAAWLAVVAIAAPALAEDAGTAGEEGADDGGTKIHGGFTSGREYVDMPGRRKTAYVQGLMDGMLLAPAFGGVEDRMEWFLTCTEAIGVAEMRDAINDYVFEHSDDWRSRNPAKFYRAIAGHCRAYFEEVKQQEQEE